jgi:hypothetical protein
MAKEVIQEISGVEKEARLQYRASRELRFLHDSVKEFRP